MARTLVCAGLIRVAVRNLCLFILLFYYINEDDIFIKEYWEAKIKMISDINRLDYMDFIYRLIYYPGDTILILYFHNHIQYYSNISILFFLILISKIISL